MDINWWAVIVATIAQFIVGAIWYSFPFRTMWSQINGFDKLSEAKQKELMSKMGPSYLLQAIVTLFTAAALDKLIVLAPSYSAYSLALVAWIGFIVPAQVSDVIFGNVEPEWKVKKVLIQAGCSLLCVLVAVAVLKAF